MHTRRTLLISLAVAVALPTVAIAEDLDGTWRPPPTGTKFVFDDDTKREVIGSEGNWVLVRGVKGGKIREWRTYMSMHNDISSDGRKILFNKKAIDELFPLQVGKETSVYEKVGEGSNKWEGRHTFRVVAVKEIQTPIGARRTFGIKMKVQGIHGGYLRRDWGYFDPALGFWWKGGWNVVRGSGGKGNWHVKSIELP